MTHDDNDPPAWLERSSLFSDDSALMYVVLGLMGTINGLLAGAVGYFVDLVYLNLHAAVWFFLIGWATTTAYLSYKRVPSGVLAVGLYFLGLFVLLQPVVIYGPVITTATDASAGNTDLFIAGWRGIFTWGLFAGALALGIAVVSRLLKRHARRIIKKRRRRGLRREDWRDERDERRR